ncbi:hypothetical protein HDA40_001698 [Hamadaea flava]|nr:hypothetical protein [Hamadaea flava]
MRRPSGSSEHRRAMPDRADVTTLGPGGRTWSARST